MRWRAVLGAVGFLLALSWGAVGSGQDSQAKPKTGIAVWDTGRSAADTLTPEALAGKNDWTAIPAEKTAASFKGDAVLSNGRIVAVLRKQDAAVEVHAVKPGRRRVPAAAALADRRGRTGRSPGAHGPRREHQGRRLPGSDLQDREGHRGRRQVPHQARRRRRADGAGDRRGQAARRMPGALRGPARFLRRRHHLRRRQAAPDSRSNCPAKTSCCT